MGSCEPSVLVEESLCGFPDGTVGELGITLGDMGGVTLESVDEFVDFQGCKDSVLDPDSSSGAACKLGDCIEDSIGRPVTEQFFCSEVACPLSNTNWDTTDPVDGCCDSSQNLRANLVGSSVGLGASISGRDDSFNRQQDTGGSVLEQKPQDECGFPSSNTSGETKNPVDGCHASSKKIGANSVDFRLESPISGWDGSPYGQQDMGVLAHEQKLQDECELSGLCSTESDQYKHLCYSGTVGLYLERQGPCHEDEMGQLMVAEEMPLASVPLTFSQSKSSQCMELKVPGEADGLSAEAVTGLKEVKEEQCDVITRISVSLGTQVSLKEDNTCNLMEGPSDVACDRAVEEKIPQLSFQLCDVVDVGSGKRLAVPDLDEGCAPSSALICGRSVDSTVQMHNEDRDCAKPKNVSGPSVETVTDSQEVVEQNVLLGTLVNQSSQELRIEENICNLMQQSLNVASECSGEESTSPQSPLTLNVVANGSSKRSDEPDLQESNVLNGFLRCSSMVGAIDSAGDEGKANSKPHFVSESNCPDGVHVLPRRSTRVSKLNQMNETRNAGNQCNNKVNSSLPKRAIGISFKIARRKRSYSCKSARSSSWGVLGSIMQVFKQNEGILKQDSDLVQAQARGSRKTEGRKGSEKRKRIRASRDSRKSNGETNASIGSVRLKVKMGEKGGQNNLKDVLPQGDNPSANGETMINESLSELNCRTSIEIPCVGEMEHKLGEDLKLSNRSLEMPVTPLDVSVLDARLADKDLVSIVTQDISVGNSGDCHVSSQIGTESSGEVAEIKNSDPGTSPHSEVINVIQEVQVGAGMQVDLQDASFDLAQVVVPPEDVMGSNVLPMKAKKGKRNGKIKGSQNPVGGCCVLDEKMHGPDKFNKTRKLSKRRSRQKVVDGLNPGEAIISATSQNASSNNSSNEGFARDSFPSSELVELGLCHEALKIETSIEARELLSHDVGDIPPESGTSELSAAKTKGFEVSKTSKSIAGVNKSRSRVSDSVRGSRKNACAKEDTLKSKRKGKVKEEVISDLDIGLQENHTELGGSINVPLVKKDSETWGPDELSKFNLVSNETSSSLTRNNAGNNVPPANISSFNVVSNGFEEQSLPPRIAWVCCDDCLKWRCISAALADSIEETNCKWTCKDNADKAFADCSIPQEKSNAEINKELDISDEEDAYDRRSNYKAFEGKQPTVPQQATWRLIKSNLFLHRSRKTQTIDEVMVCHCKPPPVGSLGCGDECLNRMLNIECVKGACPCGDLCSNQQFQKRNYAKFKQFRCGKKGYGLQLLENVSEGQFLIEYVGEVLDLHDYEARQREYASRGQKHFYFMTLNGSEVIDACAKGNLGRFINHSCEPNCRTEKWMVNGEICIGLFAIRDIKKGEEVTFDYNYVRVYGAAAKKCVCGSSVCRGYIGGDPLNAETIVRGDSDEEFPEPLMFDEDGCNEDNMDGIIPSTSSVIGAGAGAAARFTEIPLQGGDISSKSQPATVGSNILFEKEDTQRESVSFGEPSQSEFSLRMEDGLSKSVFSSPQVSVQNEGGMSKTSSSIQLVEVSLTREETTDKYVCKVQTLESSSSTANSTKKCISSSVGSNKSRSDTVEDKPNISKSRPRVKASRSGSSKKGKCIVYPVITNKSQVMAKPRKQVDGAIRSRFEGVEEKLNELLDGDGGISKRKDASKGYLKLLVLTAASGDNGNGEAFQSARDLSIILDALMKTKSRTVLTDIINKNGLQMLHNILKQNRGDFKKIPILRKLLKVLEFLALKGILTLEHINGGPPHPGMESFKDSILTLTRHSDVQVHQIARTFRDRWIPRYSRRFNYFDRDDSKLEPQSGPNSNWFAPSYKRWQDPGVRPTEVINCASQATVVPIPVETNTQEGSSEPAVGSCPASGTRKRKRKSRWDQPAETKDDPSPRHIGEQKIEPNSGQKMDSSPQKLEISDPVLDQVIDVNREKKTCSGCVENLSQQNEVSARIDAVQHIEEDVPPGFASYLNGPAGPSNVGTTITASLPTQIASPSNCGFEVITGLPQEKFLSHLPVSYGIPVPLVLQLGMLQPETIDCWSIAPGVPFHPFPPLPPFPREKSNPLPSPAAPDPVVMDGHVEAVQLPSHHVAAHNMDPSVPSTSGARSDAPVTRENNQDAVERGRGSSYGLGKRYRKWDDHATPRSPWRRNGWDNSRNGVRSVVVGNVANDGGGHCCSQDVNNEGKNARSCSYQHKPHQHHH